MEKPARWFLLSLLAGSTAVAGQSFIFVDAYADGEVQGANTIDGLHRVSAVVVSPDGAHVYATGGVDPVGDQDWIATFSRAVATGELTWLETIDHFVFCDLDILFGFETYAVIDPAGERLFITSGATAVTEFARNPATGSLTFTDAECLFDDLTLGINLPRKLGLDPAGRFFYVPGQADDSVAIFDGDGIFEDRFESGSISKWSLTVLAP